MKTGSKALAVLLFAGVVGGGISLAQEAQEKDAVSQQPSAQEAKGQVSEAYKAAVQAGANADAKSPAGAPDISADKSQEKYPERSQDQSSAPAANFHADNGETCEVPAYLLTAQSSLLRVAAAIKERKQLDVLVVGSGSSVLAGPEGASASYPARLEAALRERLKGITVNVSTDVQVRKTAANVVEGLEKLAKDRKPVLLIWQTGTVDALQSIDLDDFRAAIDKGISALLGIGVDVLLMNLQYSPRMETMISVTPYLDNMRVGAEEHNVPLFDRFAIMRHWNESGRFDLFSPSHGFGLAKRVHDCLGQVLATFIVDAAHINAAELGKR